MKKYIWLVITVMVLMSGCTANKQSSDFTETEAISKVLSLGELKEEASNFPMTSDVRVIESDGPGPSPDQNTPKMKTYYTTQASQAGKDTYIVTLAKNYNMVLNNEELVAYWLYKVTPDETVLIRSEDNTDGLLGRMK